METPTLNDKEAAAKAALAAKRAAANEQATADDSDPKSWNIYRKLFYIQQNLKVGKDRGKGHGGTVSYEYRNAQDIIERAKPLMAYTKTLIKINVVPEMIGENCAIDVRIVGKDKYGNDLLARVFGPRFVARASAYLIDAETGDSVHTETFVEVDCWRKGQTEPEKLCGSADSYASKYALSHLFGLDDGRDVDSESDTPQINPDARPPVF